GIFVFAVAGTLQGCAWLDQVDQKLEQRIPRTFLYFTADKRFAPGHVTRLPLRLFPPSEPVRSISDCDMDPSVYANSAYREALLGGTRFSDGVWVNLQEAERFHIFPFIRGLVQTGYSYANLKF